MPPVIIVSDLSLKCYLHLQREKTDILQLNLVLDMEQLKPDQPNVDSDMSCLEAGGGSAEILNHNSVRVGSTQTQSDMPCPKSEGGASETPNHYLERVKLNQICGVQSRMVVLLRTPTTIRHKLLPLQLNWI